jgi:proline racemase
MLQTVDVHAEGEIGRVVTAGVLGIPGATVADKLRHINEVDDRLRRFLCSEPRSGPAGSFCLLLPPTVAEADAAFIVLQPDRAHAMSGSNAICTVTALLETGTLPIAGPETTVTLDTAAGLVRAVATGEGGRVARVALDMPPAFVADLDASVATERGRIRYDLAFGGVFYALVDAAALGLPIRPENARALATAGVALREAIAASREVRHPAEPALDGLAYVMFRADEPDGAVRTCTTMRPGRVDRSPCGTGSNANMAVRHARGLARPGDVVVSRSTIGGEFRTELLAETTVGPHPAVRNRLSGGASIYAVTTIGLDPDDPFPSGFTLSDTWGG